MQAVVLAGGLATRMRPLTEKVPKSMLEVAGRPFVDWQLERLAACGFHEIVMCIAHLGEQIRAHVGDERAGMRIIYIDEGATLLGTAGAIRNALPVLADAFLVTYGDSYLPFDYASPLVALEAHDDCDGVMAVFANAGRWDASNVVIDDTGDGTWVTRYEKNANDPVVDHIDYGATALRKHVIAAVPAGTPRGLDGIQHALAARRRLRAVVAHARFFEIGSPSGLEELDQHLRRHPREP